MLETSLVYITRGSEVLLLHRVKKKQDVNEGKWIGVGGKLLPGETPEACALRETLEETGLTPTDIRYRAVVDFESEGWQERMHLFTANAFTGELTLCDEGDLRWVPWECVPGLPLWEGDRVFLRLIMEERPFFRLKLCYDGQTLTQAVLDGEPL